ncbi:hypothetical protein ACQP3J_32520, partial [Escherichia coli]
CVQPHRQVINTPLLAHSWASTSDSVGYFSVAVIKKQTKKQGQGNLEKKVFNLGAHSSRGLGFMTVFVGSMAAGRHGAESSHL